MALLTAATRVLLSLLPIMLPSQLSVPAPLEPETLPFCASHFLPSIHRKPEAISCTVPVPRHKYKGAPLSDPAGTPKEDRQGFGSMITA